jgi:hypothetical protein
MASVSKKEKDLYKSLDKLYNKNKESIIAWLDEVKKVGESSEKIPGLLNNSKIQIITESEDGVYNLILKWIKENKDKFEGYDFAGIPNSKYISLSNDPVSSVKLYKTFKTVADVEDWIINPLVNPINGTPLSPTSDLYYDFYSKAFNIMRKTISYAQIYYKFPKVHLLFGELDFIYYSCVKNVFIDWDKLYNQTIKKGKEYYLCELLTENIENTQNKYTILDTEIEILRNRFSIARNNTHSSDGINNLQIIKKIADRYKKSLVGLIFKKDYIATYKYEDILAEIFKDIKIVFSHGYQKNNKVIAMTDFIYFTKFNKMNNGETIIQFLVNNKTNMVEHTEWITEYINIFKSCEAILLDIDKCFDPNSGIIENIEDKKLLPIKDPLDEFFEEFEKKLEEIKKPIYSQLIDLTTFKPKENLKYLNNAQYAEFKKERDAYDELWEKYKEIRESYEKNRRGSSPKPPVKPTITLPWGKVHTIAKEIDPIHIKDKVIVKFREEYAKVEPIIDEYNILKNMSYKELKRRMGRSPTSAETQLMNDNELLRMTKEEIVDNVLYDYSGLADKCSESIDILTNEELDDENYPLAKLQLMVRLKVYIPETTKYRTECIYAPKLYNYLIKCINNKEYFVNPVTKARYNDTHIEELMKVMRIIDPDIERPVFIKHRNDTLLKINYDTRECNARDYDFHSSFSGIISFNTIYLSRVIGGVEYRVCDICTIPADIEPTGSFATGSADLSSYTMLVRIFKLFNDGKLLYNYVPPYYITLNNNYIKYIKLQIHFNRYKTINHWIFEDNGDERTKESFIEMFKHYAQEINNYHYN